MRGSLTSVLVFLGFAAVASDLHVAPDIRIDCNENGAVVTLGPKTQEPGAVYYLGNACDTFREGVGTGRWWYGASGFVIEVAGELIRFNGELPCETMPSCFP